MEKITISFYPKSKNDICGDPCVYVCEMPNDDKDVRDMLEDVTFQAIEVDHLDSEKYLVKFDPENKNKYRQIEATLHSDNIVRTNEPTKYINWKNSTPTIFTVDRENSKIRFTDIKAI